MDEGKSATGGGEEEGRDRTCVVYAGPASITSCEERAREHTDRIPSKSRKRTIDQNYFFLTTAMKNTSGHQL